jgi:hypothetical protein
MLAGAIDENITGIFIITKNKNLQQGIKIQENS